MKIGVGYSAQKFNESKAKELVFQGMESMGFQDYFHIYLYTTFTIICKYSRIISNKKV